MKKRDYLRADELERLAVELFARGRLDRRYILLRLKDNSSGKDRWFIFLEKNGPSFPLTNLPELSRENLEGVIEKLLLP